MVRFRFENYIIEQGLVEDVPKWKGYYFNPRNGDESETNKWHLTPDQWRMKIRHFGLRLVVNIH